MGKMLNHCTDLGDSTGNPTDLPRDFLDKIFLSNLSKLEWQLWMEREPDSLQAINIQIGENAARMGCRLGHMTASDILAGVQVTANSAVEHASQSVLEDLVHGQLSSHLPGPSAPSQRPEVLGQRARGGREWFLHPGVESLVEGQVAAMHDELHVCDLSRNPHFLPYDTPEHHHQQGAGARAAPAYWADACTIRPPSQDRQPLTYDNPFDPRLAFRGLLPGKTQAAKPSHQLPSNPLSSRQLHDCNLLLLVSQPSDLLQQHMEAHLAHLTHQGQVRTWPPETTGARATKEPHLEDGIGDKDDLGSSDRKSAEDVDSDRETQRVFEPLLSGKLKALWQKDGPEPRTPCDKSCKRSIRRPHPVSWKAHTCPDNPMQAPLDFVQRTPPDGAPSPDGDALYADTAALLKREGTKARSKGMPQSATAPPTPRSLLLPRCVQDLIDSDKEGGGLLSRRRLWDDNDLLLKPQRSPTSPGPSPAGSVGLRRAVSDPQLNSLAKALDEDLEREASPGPSYTPTTSGSSSTSQAASPTACLDKRLKLDCLEFFPSIHIESSAVCQEPELPVCGYRPEEAGESQTSVPGAEGDQGKDQARALGSTVQAPHALLPHYPYQQHQQQPRPLMGLYDSDNHNKMLLSSLAAGTVPRVPPPPPPQALHCMKNPGVVPDSAWRPSAGLPGAVLPQAFTEHSMPPCNNWTLQQPPPNTFSIPPPPSQPADPRLQVWSSGRDGPQRHSPTVFGPRLGQRQQPCLKVGLQTTGVQVAAGGGHYPPTYAQVACSGAPTTQAQMQGVSVLSMAQPAMGKLPDYSNKFKDATTPVAKGGDEVSADAYTALSAPVSTCQLMINENQCQTSTASIPGQLPGHTTSVQLAPPTFAAKLYSQQAQALSTTAVQNAGQPLNKPTAKASTTNGMSSPQYWLSRSQTSSSPLLSGDVSSINRPAVRPSVLQPQACGGGGGGVQSCGQQGDQLPDWRKSQVCAAQRQSGLMGHFHWPNAHNGKVLNAQATPFISQKAGDPQHGLGPTLPNIPQTQDSFMRPPSFLAQHGYMSLHQQQQLQQQPQQLQHTYHQQPQQQQQQQQQQQHVAMKKIGVNQLLQEIIAASMGGQHKPPQLPVSYSKPPPGPAFPGTMQQQQQLSQQQHHTAQMPLNTVGTLGSGTTQLHCMFPPGPGMARKSVPAGAISVQQRPLMTGGGVELQEGGGHRGVQQYPTHSRFAQQPSLH